MGEAKRHQGLQGAGTGPTPPAPRVASIIQLAAIHARQALV
jgi:hypothetical protein